MVTSKSETGGFPAPSITLVALDNVTRNGWWEPLPGNPDTSGSTQIPLEAQCGQAEDITRCIEEKTFNQSAIIKDIVLGFSSQTSLIDEDLGTEDFTSTFHGMAHTINIKTKINPDDITTQLFIIFQGLSNFLVNILNMIQHPLQVFILISSSNYQVFIHDKDFFLINGNPLGLPSINRRWYPSRILNHIQIFHKIELMARKVVPGEDVKPLLSSCPQRPRRTQHRVRSLR